MLLPNMLYNNLGAYCLSIGIDVLRQLDGGKNIKAIKESVSDRRRFSSFMKALVDQFGIFTGTDNVALKGLSSTPMVESPPPPSAFPHGSVKLAAVNLAEQIMSRAFERVRTSHLLLSGACRANVTTMVEGRL